MKNNPVYQTSSSLVLVIFVVVCIEKAMLTPRLLRLLSVYLHVTSTYFYAVPIQCETMIWSFLRLCQMHLTGEYQSIHHYVIHGFNLIRFGYPVCLQLFLMFYGQTYCDFFNQAVDYDKSLRGKYLQKRKKRKLDLLETGIAVLVPCVYLQGFCFAMFSLMKLSKPFFHCSLFKLMGWSIWAQIPIKIYECSMIINCWHVIVSTLMPFCAATYSIVMWAAELLPNSKESVDDRVRERPNIPLLRSKTHSLLIYQCLRMLCNRFNHVSKIWIAGLAFFAGKFVGIYMGFATIRLGIAQTLPITQYLAYPTSCLFLVVFLCFVSPVSEKWHTLTTLYIKQLKWHPNKMVRKNARGLTPMGAQIVDFFCIKKGFGIETAHDCVIEIGDLVMSVK